MMAEVVHTLEDLFFFFSGNCSRLQYFHDHAIIKHCAASSVFSQATKQRSNILLASELSMLDSLKKTHCYYFFFIAKEFHFVLLCLPLMEAFSTFL